MAQVSKINMGGIDYDIRDKVLEQEVANIKPIVNQGTINNAADGEDLTSENNLLKLKDRSTLNGMGYVILRKNKTFAAQVTNENTIYEVRYQYDLNGATFTMPKNCVLNFVGGQISNGTLVGNSTEISGVTTNILNNVVLTKTYTNLSCNIAWWGADNTEGFDNSAIIDNAFRSSIPVIEVSGRYYISKPIELPYNKVIKGRTGNNNKLTGFYANDDFSSVIVNFPDRQGSGAFSKEVCAMFYHRDTTKLEMHDIFVDARHKADYCIEHIDLYGSVDMYNCYLTSANKIGMLQYACENPVYDQLFIVDCHIGLVISAREYRGGNPLEDTFYDGNLKGQPNIVTTTNLRIVRCNYGIITNGVYDIKLDCFETGHNAITGAILHDTYGEINKFYSEGDAQCLFYLHADGTKEEAEEGYALQYLIDNNLDGYKAKAVCCQGVEVYLRSSMILLNSRFTITSAAISYNPRSFVINNATTYEWMTNREPQGLDSLILVKNSTLIGDTLRTYKAPNDYANDALYSVILSTGSLPSVVKFSDCDMRGLKNFVTHITSIAHTPGERFLPLQSMGRSVREEHDFNQNIENSRRDHEYQGKDERMCKYYGMVNNIPLYYYDANIMNKSIWWKGAEAIQKFFGDVREVKVKVLVKVLNECKVVPKITATYYDASYANIYNFQNNQRTNVLWSVGEYELVSYVPIKTSFEYANLAINFSGGLDTEDYVVSHIYVYAADDDKCLPHNFVSVTLPSGYTTQRPAISFRGQQFFDRNLNKVIYANETLDGWIDATGASV